MITLYTTHCPKCEILKKKLDAKGLEYGICEDLSIMTSKNFIYLPILEVDDEKLDFSQAVNYINNL